MNQIREIILNYYRQGDIFIDEIVAELEPEFEEAVQCGAKAEQNRTLFAVFEVVCEICRFRIPSIDETYFCGETLKLKDDKFGIQPCLAANCPLLATVRKVLEKG